MAEPVGLSPEEIQERCADLEAAMEEALELLAKGKVDEAEDVLEEALGEPDEDEEDEEDDEDDDDEDD